MNPKSVHELQFKVKELQAGHNRLTTMVLLLRNEISKLKRHTEYKEPEPTQQQLQEQQQQQQQQQMQMQMRGGGMQQQFQQPQQRQRRQFSGSGTTRRNVRVIDN